MSGIAQLMGSFQSAATAGLYLDSAVLSIVSGKPGGSQLKIDGFSEKDGQFVIDSTPELKQKVLDSLNLALQESGIKARSVRLAVPGDASITRHFNLPQLPKKEERNAVRFEAQKYIPFEIKELFYDYDTYPTPDKKMLTVVFFACKKQRIESLEAVLQLAGLKIAAVELACQSVARAYFKKQDLSPDEVSVVISSNADKTAEIIIQKAGLVLTTRHLSLAYGADGTTVDLPQFVSEVRISLDYFSECFKFLKASNFFIVTPFAGDAASLGAALEKEFSMPVASGALYSQATHSGTPAVAAQGAAMAQMDKRGSKKINLKASEAQTQSAPALSWEEENKKLQQMAIKEIIGVVLLLVVLYFAAGSMVASERAKLQKALAKYPKSRAVSMSETADALKKKETATRSRVTYLKTFFDNRLYLTEKLNRLVATLTPDIQLLQLTYSNTAGPTGEPKGNLRLEGIVLRADVGAELTVVNELVDALKKDEEFMKGFEDVIILSTKKVTLRGAQRMRFSVACVLGKASV